MLNLLNDVLTVSKSNAGRVEFAPRDLDLDSFCRQIWDDFVELAENKRQMEYQYRASRSRIKADPQLLQQILVNLLSNAVKYTPEGKRVLFEISDDADWVTFQISDSGNRHPAPGSETPV